jgi:hypothetical protein
VVGTLNTSSLSISNLTGPLQAVSGSVSASSTLSISYGGTGLSTAPTTNQILLGNSSGTYSLTNFGTPFYNFFSATTTDALAQGSTNKYYSDTLVNSFIAASTTIPKTYTANNFTAAQTFGSTVTISTTSPGCLNISSSGLLYAATCFSFSNTLANGGTATTTFYNGGVVFSDGAKLTQSSSLGNFFWDETNKRLGIGTSSPMSALAVAGIITANSINATSTTATSTFSGGLQANLLNVTSQTATSTFANGINLTGKGCFAISGTCIATTSGTVNSASAGQFAYYAANGSTVSGQTALTYSGGLIGIGTTNPGGSRLDILADSGDTAALVLDTGASSNPQAIQFARDGVSSAYVYLASNLTLGWQASLNPYSDNGAYTLGTPSFRWRSISVGTGASSFGGDVTISGQTTLATSLNGVLQAVSGVVSATSSIGVSYGGTGSTSFAPNSIITSNSAGTALIATGTQLTVGNLLATSTTATSSLAGALTVGGSKLVVQQNTGAVGIGTSNPSYYLDISVNSPSLGLFRVGSSNGATQMWMNDQARLYITNGIESGNIQVGSQLGGDVITWNQNNASKIDFTGGHVNIASTNNLLLTPGLNVGIGSTTPGYKLSVAGSAYFDGGTIRSQDIIATSTLTISTTTAGCLSVNASGLVYSSTCNAGSLTAYDAFTHPASGVSATTSELRFAGF